MKIAIFVKARGRGAEKMAHIRECPYESSCGRASSRTNFSFRDSNFCEALLGEFCDSLGSDRLFGRFIQFIQFVSKDDLMLLSLHHGLCGLWTPDFGPFRILSVWSSLFRVRMASPTSSTSASASGGSGRCQLIRFDLAMDLLLLRQVISHQNPFARGSPAMEDVAVELEQYDPAHFTGESKRKLFGTGSTYSWTSTSAKRTSRGSSQEPRKSSKRKISF